MNSADDVNPLGDNIDTMNKNTETLIDVSKEVGLCSFSEYRMMDKVRKLSNSECHTPSGVVTLVKTYPAVQACIDRGLCIYQNLGKNVYT
jgi:hypothetical protein